MASLDSPAAGRIAVSGDLTAESVPALELQGGQRLAAGGATRWEIDLAGVGFGSSAGVSLLLSWLRRGRAAGVEVVFRNLPQGMRDIIRVTGLNSIIPVAE